MTPSDESDADEPTARVTHEVPESVYQDAKQVAEWGERTEYVRMAYRTLAYGDAEGSRSRLQFELERVREQKDNVRARIRDLQAELEDIEQRETRLEERLDKAKTADEKYKGHLESLETNLRDGMNVYPGHGAVERAASIGNKTPEEVVDDLQERNPSLPAHAFIRADRADIPWRGVADEDRDA